MMKSVLRHKHLILFIPLALALAGCVSEAGPFVTDISSDGRGGIVVQKCMVKLQRQINTVEASNCTSTDITLSQIPANSTGNSQSNNNP